ncbi:MAG: ribosome maturation factor RimM [Prevotellaceae bacterium]|jgi:16S rRNA processing protein RimM|nr:ribosome maturation factor RimM [Prevotellaceae bacterium]
MKTAEKYLLFGNILKTFGKNGELIVKFDSQAFSDINLEEPVFIIIDGLPVPFYLKIFDERSNNRALVIFENIETEKLAKQLVGMQILLPYKKQTACKDFNLNRFEGFHATDIHAGNIGIITEFLDFPNNPCFCIIHNDKEILVPVNEDFIESIDEKSKIINFNLPEGLIDFYMNG